MEYVMDLLLYDLELIDDEMPFVSALWYTRA